ncbi:MAG TPA: (Fe-S)-binding protein [Polyangiaceae bacterium]
MNPALMAFIILSLASLFAWSATHRGKLLRVGERTWESRIDRVGKRLEQVWTFAVFQKKMRYYFWAGIAHQLIFLGFLVLLARSVMLWGRGFDPTFNLWILGDTPLGHAYSWLKDVFATLVLIGVAVFVYYRVIRPQKRMSLSGEGLLILGIISTMMLGDMVYDGASRALQARFTSECGSAEASDWCARASTLVAQYGPESAAHSLEYAFWPEPAGSLFALLLEPLDTSTLVVLGHAGFWSHSTLVLIFLNILPYSKHFHIITAIPNVFFTDLTPRGRLRPLAKNTEDLMAMVEKASEQEDMNAARIGYSRIQHFTWKDILDFYTCTECGRCSDNCPATTTGKLLSPKHLTLHLRDHLYARQDEFLKLGTERAKTAPSPPVADGDSPPPEQPLRPPEHQPVDLVPEVVHQDVLWGCTTCRACEQQCPVNITYVDKIVQMRRNLVMIRGEFPAELNKPFEGMETNGNPWNLARVDRATWAEGLGLRTFAEAPTTEVLFWVGCAASYDDRSKKIARATARLLQAAGVDFAILADEESCTGDPARRAGNEYLFSMLAEANIETLNGYQGQGGARTIVTTCPHCFNTLANEYADFGGRYQVVHHTDYLLGLVAAGKLVPRAPVKARVVFHDSCYLGRYNDIYESPRQILGRIPGVELVETKASRDKGLCCGAGGAQMWMEEQNNDRMNVKRTGQLLATGADTIASACPFCMTMLSDGVKAAAAEEKVRTLDVVEMLDLSCESAPAAAE